VSDEKTPRGMAPKPRTTENEQNLEDERQALRRLIDTFRHQQGGDDAAFYRNVGRFIARPMMKPDWPDDKNN
jgi:thioesterase domain-containing protein